MTKKHTASNKNTQKKNYVGSFIWPVIFAGLLITSAYYFYIENQRYSQITQNVEILQDHLKKMGQAQLENNTTVKNLINENNIKFTKLIHEKDIKINTLQEEIEKTNETIFTEAEDKERTRGIYSQKVFGGIGINFDKTPNGLYIKGLLPDGSAKKSGELYIGDLIVEIEGKSVNNMTLKEVAENLRGEAGTNIMLSYKPAGTVNILKVVGLARELIDLTKYNSDELNGIFLPPLEKEMLQSQNKKASEDCIFSEPAKDQKIAFVNVHEGRAVSNISVAGQDEETRVIPVQIDEGQDKLFVILSSNTPLIWQIKDEANRIEKLILAGPSSPEISSEKERLRTGASGVPSAKIAFLNSNKCGLKYESENNSKDITVNALKKNFGRTPDLFLSEYNISGVHILNDRINTDISSKLESLQRKAPKGFDATLWANHIRFTRGGLIKLKAQDIVSSSSVEAYKVLPGWAGMAKLAHDGAIIPYNIITADMQKQFPTMSNANTLVVDQRKPAYREFGMGEVYKIVKNIPYYPSGLYGAHMARFILAKGLKIPKGHPGHSYVMLEETNEIIASPRTPYKQH